MCAANLQAAAEECPADNRFLDRRVPVADRSPRRRGRRRRGRLGSRSCPPMSWLTLSTKTMHGIAGLERDLSRCLELEVLRDQ